MLVHLSSTSPYVCDLNRGPVEPANRMASASTKKATALLEHKESFPKQTRTPLKLLAPDEVPMDTTTAPTDANASLQPVWYTEQTIVDDQHGHQEDIASIIQEQQQGKSLLPRTTLSPILSESPTLFDEIEELPNQPSLMHKSSTFTIEPSMNADSPLNDSEKENLVKDDTTDAIIQPSDDSFRALEQLLGLGSANTVRESPKTNHDTLSLTVVTPTDIINSTRRSSRLSYAQKGGTAGSLPSSQEIPPMPTIESIASADPPSFLADNTAMEEEQPSMALPATQQSSFDVTDNDTIKDDSNNDDETNFSFELNDFPDNSNTEPKVNIPAPAQPMLTIRAPTCADVAYRALVKPRTGGRISQPVKADSPLAKPSKARSSAPSSRTLRSSAYYVSAEAPVENSVVQERPASTDVEQAVRNTELFEMVTLPEDDENEQDKTAAITLNVTSSRQSEHTFNEPNQITTPPKPIPPMLSREYTYNTPKRRSSQRRRSTWNSLYATPTQVEPPATITEEELRSPSIACNSMLEILLTKPTEKVTRKTSIAPSPVRSSKQALIRSPGIASQSMLGVLLTKPTETSPKATRKISIVPSPVRTSKRSVRNQQTTSSPTIASKSMLEVLLTKTTEARTPQRNATVNQPTDSPAIASKSMLEVLLTKPTEVTPRSSRRTASATSSARSTKRNTLNVPMTESPSIPSQSMLGILLTNPSEDNSTVVPDTPIQSSVRTSRRSSSHPTPRASINPLHSSTPASSRHKSLQMVNIGEEEQLTTTVPQQINIEIHRDEPDVEMVPLNDTTVSVRQPSTFEIGVQTTPSLDKSARRHSNTSQPRTTPVAQMHQSVSSVVIVNEEEQRQITPIQSKVIVNLQRSVRFQLTPSTDARLVVKEQMEENLRGSKPDVVIEPAPVVPGTQPKVAKAAPIKKATKPKKKVLASKKKKVTPKRKAEPKARPVQKQSHPARKGKPTKQEKVALATKATPPTKRVARKRTAPAITTKPVAKQAPPKRATNAITKRAAPKAAAQRIAKRTTQKRAMPKTALESIMEHAAPKATTTEAKTKPVPKPSTRKPTASKTETDRIAKSSSRRQAVPEIKSEPVATKRVQSKRTTKVVASEPNAERASIKRSISEATTEPATKRAKTSKSAEVSVPTRSALRTRGGSTNTAKTVAEPVAKKTSKRRLPSVENTNESKKKIEKKDVETAVVKQEEQPKIEGLTVAELKARLNKHKEVIPKNAKKADLVALLLKLETNSLPKQNDIAPTTKTTRPRRKN